jgi:hypothetical protein
MGWYSVGPPRKFYGISKPAGTTNNPNHDGIPKAAWVAGTNHDSPGHECQWQDKHFVECFFLQIAILILIPAGFEALICAGLGSMRIFRKNGFELCRLFLDCFLRLGPTVAALLSIKDLVRSWDQIIPEYLEKR